MQKRYWWPLIFLQSYQLFATQDYYKIPASALKFAKEDSKDMTCWRDEMNYWYDQCAIYNDLDDDSTFSEKLEVLKQNMALDIGNQELKQHLMSEYPKTFKLDDQAARDLKYKKFCELKTLEEQAFEVQENQPSPKLLALEEEVKMLTNKACNLELESGNEGLLEPEYLNYIFSLLTKSTQLQMGKSLLAERLQIKKIDHNQEGCVSSPALVREIETLNNNLNKLQKQLKSLTQENNHFKRESQNAKKTINKLTQQNIALQTTIAQLEDQNVRLFESYFESDLD